MGVGPPSGSPNPGPGWQRHSPAAPDPLPASARGPGDRTFGRSLTSPRDAPAYASIAPCAAFVPELQPPTGPPQRRSAHLRTRAAPVAPPRGYAPFPPTCPGPLWPGLRSSRCPRDFLIRASRRGRSVERGRGVACGLQLSLPPRVSQLCRPEDLRKPHIENAFTF